MKSSTLKGKILDTILTGCVIAVFGLMMGVLPAFADVADVHHDPDLIPPHPDVISDEGVAEVGWEDDAGYHQHRSNHTLFYWGNDVIGDAYLGLGYYYAQGVWTNETYHYVSTNANPTTEGSHGFIEEASDPDYYFENREGWSDWSSPVAQKAKQYIIAAFNAYSSITLDDVSISKGLMTGLSFSETQNVAEAEIRVQWAPIDPTLATVGYFSPFTTEGGYHVLAFNSEYNMFYFGDSKEEFLDPAYEGVWDRDFYTIALHEIGHVIGLGHQMTLKNDYLDIMSDGAGFISGVRIEQEAFREIGNDATEGARDLYTRSTPEPVTGLMALLGLLPGVWAYIRRRWGK